MRGSARGFALGLGLTNECNLACSFCYRDPNRIDRLTLDQVRAIIDRLPVRSVNLGTGENGMHPEFLAILDFLRAQPVKLTIKIPKTTPIEVQTSVSKCRPSASNIIE